MPEEIVFSEDAEMWSSGEVVVSSEKIGVVRTLPSDVSITAVSEMTRWCASGPEVLISLGFER